MPGAGLFYLGFWHELLDFYVACIEVDNETCLLQKVLTQKKFKLISKPFTNDTYS